MLQSRFILILLANVILGSALPMLIILGVLAGDWLAPQSWLATAPPTVSMLAGIVVAAPISLFMGRFGRRLGFLLGAGALCGGALLAIAALFQQSFVLLCIAHFALGTALICVNFFRFAAAEAVSEDRQPQAISFTLASGLVAALVGPEVFSWSKDALAPIPLAGAYGAVAALAILGAVPVLALGPMIIPRTPKKSGQGVALRALVARNPRVALAIGIAALSQFVMVLLMTPTPLAMIGCGFDEIRAADVIRWHVVAMFAPGFVTGWLIKRFGADRIAALGLVLILASAVVAWSGLELLNFYIALIVLGVGWNFGFISGTYMLQAAIPPDERSVLQGANDTIIAVASGSASLLSGALYAGVGWLGLVGLTVPVSLILCGLLLRTRQRTLA